MIPPVPEESTIVADPLVSRATAVFRAGFWSSLALLTVGVCLLAVRSESLPSRLVPLEAVVSGLLKGSSDSFITLGIMTMILTPVVSTVAICLTFLQARDRRYAMLSSIVLLILILSVSLSLR